MLKKTFSFNLKALFVLMILLKFCSYFFNQVRKQLGEITSLNFKIYDNINWESNHYHTHIAQYLKN